MSAIRYECFRKELSVSQRAFKMKVKMEKKLKIRN
jgi:hypothetical protein